MTRTYAAKRLFEHGPLSFREFVEITGWTVKQCYATINNLQAKRRLNFIYMMGHKARIYALA